MFIVLASLVTFAAAAPRVAPYTHFSQSDIEQYSNIYPNLDDLGVTKNQFYLQFNSAPWTVSTKDLQYVMSMPMPGYNKEDIEVLALNKGITVRAIQKEGDDIVKSQIVVTLLPAYVNPLGRWTYDGVLRIAFPIKWFSDDGSSYAIPVIIDA
ncbi:uncharacterized protein LOC119190523 [Manduca sexta]|uniref:uncharacterized protein LOC119190523 n=1 Tax=Manduca sexta TaxID=7130 RepID=UPI00189085D0|nr:uncharacterized protein LOC119190523 [Manduca sexta]